MKQYLSSDTKHVWLTIGGNDAQRALPGCGLPCVPRLQNETVKRVQHFVEPALAAHPQVRVVMAGYDIFNFGASLNPECLAKGLAFLPQCAGPRHIECFNEKFLELFQKGIVEALASPRLTAVDIRGALQAAGGVPGARVGAPVLSSWSPDALMQPNCIHPKFGEGFTAIMDALWTTYFERWYGRR